MPDDKPADIAITAPADSTTVVTAPPSTPDATKAPDGKDKPDSKTTVTDPLKDPVAPEKYELKLPEEAVLKPADVDAIVAFAKEHKLPEATAQKLLEQQNQERVGFLDSQKEFLKQQVTAWGKALTTDKEIAGDKGTEYTANIESAKLVIGKYASPELIKQLNATGFGNHPELVRMMVRIGKAMREDTFHTGGSSTKTKDTAELFYPNQSKG